MIKILTLLSNNYGGCLQMYALQKKIEELGYEVEQINYKKYMSKKINIKQFIKIFIYFKRNRNFKTFKNTKLNIGKKITKIADDGSIYIAGSDQIWNPQIAFKFRKNFFLSFVNNRDRKNSYAASIGTVCIDSNTSNIVEITKLLSDFNIITVREKTAETLLKDIGVENVQTVLDPTLLLTSEEWTKETKKYNSKKYMLVYTLGFNEKNNKYIDRFSDYCELKIVDITYKKRFKNTLKTENNFGPIEFISSIKNADFVVTNSFHGTVFSILFHKEFVTITRGNMNSRIYDLLKMLGLGERIVHEDELETLEGIKLEKIDYEKVDNILKKERSRSVEILKQMLK